LAKKVKVGKKESKGEEMMDKKMSGMMKKKMGFSKMASMGKMK